MFFFVIRPASSRNIPLNKSAKLQNIFILSCRNLFFFDSLLYEVSVYGYKRSKLRPANDPDMQFAGE